MTGDPCSQERLGASLGRLLHAHFGNNTHVDVTPYVRAAEDMPDAQVQRLMRHVLINARRSGMASMDRTSMTVSDLSEDRDLAMCTLIAMHYYLELHVDG